MDFLNVFNILIPSLIWISVCAMLVQPSSKSKKIDELERRIIALEKQLNKDNV